MAVADTVSVAAGVATAIDVLGNDTDEDNDTLLVLSVTQGSKGAVSINANATVKYLSQPNATGADSFTYTASDGKGGLATATVSVNIVQGPPAPVNLIAVGSNGQIALSWGASAGAVQYRVKRATVSGGPYTQIATVNSPSTNHIDTGVTTGNTYYYIVTAVNAVVEGAPSNEASATASTPAPGSGPANLLAVPGDAQVTLSWSAVSGATQYHVKRSLIPGGPYTDIATPTATSYTDTGLTNGRTYYYVVSAQLAAGQSGLSNEASATPQEPPASALTLSATLGYQKVRLSWTASARATKYEVWRSVNSAAFALRATVDAPTTTYTDTGLTNGTPYQYYVRAWNAGGYSANSNTVSVTPGELPPDAPGQPTFSNITSTNVRVTAPPLPWNANSLTLQRQIGTEYIGGGAAFVNVASGLAGGAHTEVSGLNPLTTYYFRYVAVGDGGNTPGYTNWVTTLPPAPAAPAAPTFRNVTYNQVTVVPPSLPAYATSFTLQKKLASDAATLYTDVQTGLGSSSSVTVTGLSAATAYSFRFVAVGLGGSTPGLGAEVTTAPAPPGAPTFSNITSTGVRVTAPPPPLPTGAASLSLQKRYANGGDEDYVTIASGIAAGQYTDVTGLEPSTAYLFRYVSVSSSGSTPGPSGSMNTSSSNATAPGAPRFRNIMSTQLDVIMPAKPSGADTLTLQQKLGGAADSTYVDVATGIYYGGQSTTVTGLTPGETYTFRCLAVSAGSSVAGPGANVMTAPAAPGLPTFSGITLSSVQVTAPALSQGAASLSLQKGSYHDSMEWETVATNLAAGAVTTVSGLNHPDAGNTYGFSGVYYFRYVAVNAGGSTAGNAASVQTLPPAPLAPDAPEFIHVQATSLEVLVPTLPPYADSLNLQQKLSSADDSTYVIVSTNVYSAYPVLVTGLTPLTSYTFRFVAVGLGGTTNGTAASVTTPEPAPDAPGTVSFSAITQTTLTATLPDTFPARATSLKLQRRVSYNNNNTFVDVAVNQVAGTAIAVTGLSPGTNYSFRCVAVGAGGSTPGAESGVATATGAPLAPEAPEFRDLGVDSVTVLAPPIPGGAYSLKLQAKISSQPVADYWEVAKDLAAGAATEINGLDSGQSYDFRYLAVGPGGSTAGPVGSVTMPIPSIAWSVGTDIACGGIRYPGAGATLGKGLEGRLSSYLAMDWDGRAVTVNGNTINGSYSDPCSYTWSASGGSFKNGVNKGQGVVWVAPNTAGTYTITLTVDDQASANKPAAEAGSRSDPQRGFNDEPLRFKLTITVP